MRSFKRAAVDLVRRCDAALGSRLKMPAPIARWLHVHTAIAISLRAVLFPLVVGYYLAAKMAIILSAPLLLVGSVWWIVRGIVGRHDRAESRFVRGIMLANGRAEARRLAERVLSLGLVWAVVGVAIAVPKPPDQDIGYLEYESVPLRVVASDLDDRAERCTARVFPEETGSNRVTLRTARSVSLREAVGLVAEEAGVQYRIINLNASRDSLLRRGPYRVDFYAPQGLPFGGSGTE